MRGWAWAGCAIVMALVGVTRAHAETSVQVLETHPSGAVITLASNQNFYLHLRYRTDRPVQIWARPYFRGKAVNAGSNPSRSYPAGSGEALGWFFLFKPGTQVDEVRISAGDGSYKGTQVVATYPVQIIGGDQPVATQDQPAWVTRLNALDATAQKAGYERQMNAPVSAGDRLLLGGFMLGMLTLGILGFAAPAWGLWRWRGGWRIAAAIPAAIMAFVVLRIIAATAIDPTSHNLWPFEIVMWGGLSCAWILVLAVARRLFGSAQA